MSGVDAPRHADLPRTDHLRPLPERIVRTLRPLGQRYMYRRWDIRQHHTERIPRSGGVVLASNHLGYLDGPFIVGLPPRPVHAVTKSEMFVGSLGHLLRITGQISVVRNTNDVAAVRTCLRALRDGQVVGIFPEARRGNGEFDRVRRGYVYLALVTGAPIVPVAFFGTRQAGEGVEDVAPPGRRIDIVYGEPIEVSARPWPRTRELVDATSAQVQKQLVEHLVEARAITGRDLPGEPPRPDPEGIVP